MSKESIPITIKKEKKESSQEKEGQKKENIQNKRIEKYYYKIVFGFVIMSVLLMVLIVYFAFSKTEITVYAKKQTQEITLTATLSDVDGVLMFSDIGDETTFTDIEQSVNQKIGKAEGTVTIFNETSDDQPLLETTRLLSEGESEEDRVLFRTQEYAVIPANGSAEVSVIADEEGAVGDIPPSDFEVVALAESLKSSVYGKSTAAMSGGITETTAISETDIENAKKAGEEKIKTQALTLFQNELKERTDIPSNAKLIENIFIVETPIETVSAEENDVAKEIIVNQQMTVAAPVINTDAMMSFINNELPEKIDENRVVVSNIDPNSVTISIDEISENQTDAKLSLSFSVETTISENNDLVLPSTFLNSTKEEIRNALLIHEEIEDVQIDFSPFWARRSGGSESSINITIETK